jgi:hypothetical protein
LTVVYGTDLAAGDLVEHEAVGSVEAAPEELAVPAAVVAADALPFSGVGFHLE